MKTNSLFLLIISGIVAILSTSCDESSFSSDSAYTPPAVKTSLVGPAQPVAAPFEPTQVPEPSGILSLGAVAAGLLLLAKKN